MEIGRVDSVDGTHELKRIRVRPDPWSTVFIHVSIGKNVTPGSQGGTAWVDPEGETVVERRFTVHWNCWQGSV